MTARFVYWMNVSLDLFIERTHLEQGAGDWLRIDEQIHCEFVVDLGAVGFEPLAGQRCGDAHLLGQAFQRGPDPLHRHPGLTERVEYLGLAHAHERDDGSAPDAGGGDQRFGGHLDTAVGGAVGVSAGPAMHRRRRSLDDPSSLAQRVQGDLVHIAGGRSLTMYPR